VKVGVTIVQIQALQHSITEKVSITILKQTLLPSEIADDDPLIKNEKVFTYKQNIFTNEQKQTKLVAFSSQAK
jgi:hypothetical protein